MGMLQALAREFIETDDLLVARACAGDSLAFAQLVDRHSRDALATALGLLRDRSEAEEAVQEAFCRAWRNLSTLEDRARFRVWMTGILYRRCCDVLRSRVRARKAADALLAVDRGPREPGDQAAAVVDEAMELPDEFRQPLVLFYLQGLSVPELAETLGITVENAKVRLHRGRKMLRERLERKGLR
jgi:RNA polymerase sigma-70 factor, ECF subfamily